MNLLLKKLKTLLKCDFFFYLLLLFSIIFSAYRVSNYDLVKLVSDKSYNFFVTNYKIDGDYLRLEGTIDKVKVIATYYINSYEEQQYLLKNILFGTLLEISGEVKEASSSSIPNGFDYKTYLMRDNVFNIIEIDKINILKQSDNILYKIKNMAYKRALDFSNPTYIYAFILGKTNYIDSNINQSYLQNGITHLFALSGLHVSIFALIIINLLKVFKIKELFRIFIVFIMLLIFSFITGSSPSILRATLLFFLIGINKYFRFGLKTENVLIISLFILLLIRPSDVYNVGFQLSYIITFFLILCNKYFNNKNKLFVLFLISILSFISSFPLVVNLNNEVNVFSIINNIFFVPYVTYIVFPLTILTFIFPFFLDALNIVTNIMEDASQFFKTFSITIIFRDINIYLVFIYYFCLFVFIKYKKKSLLFINLLIILYLKLYNYFDKNTYIYFLDVGQGDSTLILTESKKSIVIDTGGKINFEKEKWAIRNNDFSLCKDVLISFYKSIGIKRINYLILTHGDTDHMGESICLVNNFDVEKVIFNSGEYNDLELELINVLNEKSIPYYQNIKELVVEDIKLYSLNNKLYDNENDNSIILFSEINNYKLLLMGDASVWVERDLIEKYNLEDIDILKVGHHGSKTSTSEDFIDETKPKYGIISVGKDNRYNHPSNTVLKALDKTNIFRTDIDGSIIFKFHKSRLKINTCPP